MPQMPGSLALAPPQVPPDLEAHAAPHRRTTANEARAIMTVSIPLVLILAAAAFVAWRYMGLKVWQAVLCILLGFFVAATTAAPEIRQLVTAIVQWLTSAKT
jgi:hypothetical protein